jgi:NADP-reducing hydrogenase subunit HndB
MEKITSKEVLNRIKQQAQAKAKKDWIRVGVGTCGEAAGAGEVFKILSEQVKKLNLPVEVTKCGCIGMCYAEPLVEINLDGMPKVFYGKVDKAKAVEIVEKHICGKTLLDDHIFEVN